MTAEDDDFEALRREHAELHAERAVLRQNPNDHEGHRVHIVKLHAHMDRVRAHNDRLRARIAEFRRAKEDPR